MSEQDRDVRQEIIATLTQVSDHTLKAILLLMLQMAEQSIEHIDGVSKKIDQILLDEARIKAVVLNGHSAIHDAHHRWIDVKIKAEEISAADRRGLKNAVLEKVLIALLAGGAGLLAPQILGWFK